MYWIACLPNCDREAQRYRRQWLMAGIRKTDGLLYAKEQKKIMDATLAYNAALATKLLNQHYDNAVIVIEQFFIANNWRSSL